MGKISVPNRLKRNDKLRKFPVLSAPLSDADKEELVNTNALPVLNDSKREIRVSQ